MTEEMFRMLRWAAIIVGTVILGYFVLGMVRSGGHEAANVAGSLQNQIH